MAARPKTRARRESTELILLDDEKSSEMFGRIFDLIANGYDGKTASGGYTTRNQQTNFSLICKEMGVDYHMMWNEIQNTPELKTAFDNARKARADRLIDETLDIADEPAEDMVHAVDKKTRIAVRQHMAKVHHREVYGDKIEVANMNVDLVQIFGEAQKRLEESIKSQREEKVVEGERVG